MLVILAFVVFMVLLASALCSGSEAALMSLPLAKARQLAEERVIGSAPLLRLKENSTRPVTAIVVLNNVANIGGSILVGQVATDTLGSAYLGIFSAMMTFLIILFSEIIPKTLAQRYSEPVSLWIARPIDWLAWSMTPLLWVLEKVQSLMGEEEVNITNEAELRFLARAGGTEGVIEPDESEMILRVFEMNDLTARDIMTPRTAMTYLRLGQTQEEIIQVVRDSEHSRIIVVGNTLDDCKGFVLRSDLLVVLLDGVLVSLEDYIIVAEEVPEDMLSDELLVTFRKTKQHLALVRGPYGGLSGVVTLEDVLEVLTGEIMDETDRHEDMQERALSKFKAI